MPSPINKKELSHLAELAQIELTNREIESLAGDIRKIVDYFEELAALDTNGVAPMTGGIETKNAFREDTERENTNQGGGTDAFPESQDGYLKVPPVFGQ